VELDRADDIWVNAHIAVTLTPDQVAESSVQTITALLLKFSPVWRCLHEGGAVDRVPLDA
jgi:hypothetical protein